MRDTLACVIVIFAILAAVNLISAEQSQNQPDFEIGATYWDVDDVIPKGYNRLIPPRPGVNKSVSVHFSLNVTQILAVKEDEQVSGLIVEYN